MVGYFGGTKRKPYAAIAAMDVDINRQYNTWNEQCLKCGGFLVMYDPFIIKHLNSFAEGTPFTGPSVGASFAYQASSVAINTIDGLGQNSTGINLNGSYGLGLSDTAVALIGMDYALSDIKTGEIIGTASSKLNKAYSLFIAPGILVNQHTLAYVKLSYVSATLNTTDVGGTTLSKKFNGTGVGFGMRTEINQSTYLNAEIKQVKYNSELFDGVTTKPTTTIGTVGIGYNF
jgi:hypothetical protein